MTSILDASPQALYTGTPSLLPPYSPLLKSKVMSSARSLRSGIVQNFHQPPILLM